LSFGKSEQGKGAVTGIQRGKVRFDTKCTWLSIEWTLEATARTKKRRTVGENRKKCGSVFELDRKCCWTIDV
jgi:hypothetical protein